MPTHFRSLILTFCGIFMVATLAASSASAAENPFSVPQASGIQLAAGEQKCAAGKCQAGKCQGAPAASKCGGMSVERKAELRSMCAEKVRSGFCGAGKCGGGKCGESLKETCAKMIEGKCGEAQKCGAK